MTDTESGLWWRNRWMEAVYSSSLKPLERFVATVFADHAGPRRVTFVTLSRLMQRTGLSRDAANRALRGLEDAGWLIAQSRKPRKPVDFALVIPEGAGPSGVPTSTGDGPVASTPPVPVEPQLVRETDSAGTPREPTSTGDVLHQSSIPGQHPSSSSPAHKHLAGLLGWAEDDERLDLLDDFLKTNNVKSARGWLNRCHENGDLERNYLAFVEEQQHAEEERRTTSLASLPKCPTCNAPQEITHYDECPDRRWDPHEALEHQPTDKACPYGCGPFVVWTDTGGRCRLCSRYNSFYAGWQTEEFLDELRSVCSSEEQLQRALEDEADDLFRDRTKAREPVVIANALLTYRQAVANPNTVTIRRFVDQEAS